MGKKILYVALNVIWIIIVMKNIVQIILNGVMSIGFSGESFRFKNLMDQSFQKSQIEGIRYFYHIANIYSQLPWRKYRIEIHSESIRTIPNHSDICIRANANHSESIRKTFCISFDEKRSKHQSK